VGFLVCRYNGSGGSLYDIPADRETIWQPGLTHNGGFPHASWPERSVLTWASGDQVSRVQSEVNAAHTANPNGVIVLLGAGTWNMNGGDVVLPSNVCVRGAGYSAGAHTTILTCTNGATDNSYIPGPGRSKPIFTIGGTNSQGTSTNLSADATKGTYSCTVASATGLSVGQYVLIDEFCGSSWQTDPQGMGQVWANSDFSVVWQRHNPWLSQTDDPIDTSDFHTYNEDTNPAASWFCRTARPQNEIKKISGISGTTITFDSPFHKTYYSSRTAQLTPYSGITTYSGIEDMALSYGDNGNVRLEGAAYCWVKRCDASHWLNENICINNCFRCEVSGSYLHDGAWPEPGGGGYAISQGWGSSENLIEDNIIRWTCKNLVARSAGTASVAAYNYLDEAFDQSNENWQEVHLSASHMVGSFMHLFEGNYAPNGDNDKTHGNATHHTYFRNHLSGFRRAFTSYEAQSQDDASTKPGAQRCAGMAAFSRFMNWVGNVLGTSGQMTDFVYEDTTNQIMVSSTVRAVYSFGWDDWYSNYPTIQPDVDLLATTLRDGNYDYLTNSVRWHGVGGSGAQTTPPAASTLPSSLYLSSKPSFFGTLTWPWVTPEGSTKLYTNPAKRRFDLGTPFADPP